MSADLAILTSVAWLGTYLIHSTLFLGAAWLLTRQRMLSAPRLSERIWRLALFGGLLTASVQVIGGTRPTWATYILESDQSLAAAPTLEEGETRALPSSTSEDVGIHGAHGLQAVAHEAKHSKSTADRSARLEPELTGAARPSRDAQPKRRAPRAAQAKRSKAPSDSQPFEPTGSSESTSSRSAAECPEQRPMAAERSDCNDDAYPVLSEAPEPLVPAALLESAEPAGASPSGTLEPDTNELGATESSAALASASPSAADASQPHWSASMGWKYLVLSGWILAGGLGLVGFLWACSCLLARMSKRRRIVSGPLLEQLETLRHAAGLKHEVKLYASATLDSPITYGWIRPRICLPLRAISDLTPAQQQSLLAHEMAHVMRGDPLWFSLYTLVVRLLCLQPLNRLARRELLEGAELLCDDWAVRWTGQRLGLASCLTEIAQWILRERRPALISAGMAEQPSRLGVRVERLLDDRRAPLPEPRHSWWSPTALGLLVLFTGAAPGFSSTEPRVPEPEAPGAEASVLPVPSAPWWLSEPNPSPELRSSPRAVGPLAASSPSRLSSPVKFSSPVASQVPVGIPAEAREPAWPAEPQPAMSAPSTKPSAPPLPQPLAMELGLERSLLDEELELLQLELEALRIEVAESRKPKRFRSALLEAEQRIQNLRRFQERLNGLLDATQPTSTHPSTHRPISK